MNYRVIFGMAVLLVIIISGCYYDRESELYPIAKCDTVNVTWGGTIRPMVQQQCAYVGCHVGSAPGGGIDLSNYNGVKGIASSGALMGSIEHSGNYTSMPHNRAKLPACEISKVRVWVNAGALEN